MQFVLADDARRFGHEKREQIERFRRQMNLDAVLEQLSSLHSKLEAVELYAHRRSPDFPRNLSRFPLNLSRSAPDLNRLRIAPSRRARQAREEARDGDGDRDHAGGSASGARHFCAAPANGPAIAVAGPSPPGGVRSL